jgi:hypothetical protein
MVRLIRVSLIVALLSLFAGAPAWAGPYMSYWQWTSNPGVPFSQCWDRGARALRSVGLSASQHGRFFDGSDDAFTAFLICYDLGNRFILTIGVAQSGSSSMTTDQVRDRMAAVIFGSGGGTASNCASSSPVGTWRWWDGNAVTFYSNGTSQISGGHSGTWERLNDGSFHVHWDYPSDDYFTISADGGSMPGTFGGHAGTSTRRC